MTSLVNSLLLASETAFISVIFAAPMAWAVSRTNMPGKATVWALVLGAFILPPYLGAIGWILLAGPNAGFINLAWRTLTGAGASATFSVLLALLAAYIVTRKLVRFGEALGFLAMAPFVIPGIVMAIGFYAAFARPPFALYGTAAIIILAFTARFLPIAYASASAAMGVLHPEMEEAARILGCGRLRTIARITAPLLKKSLLGGWLIVFIVATRELSAAIFLVGPNTRTMAVLLYDLSEAGNFEVVAALGGILLALTLVLVAMGMALSGRDFMLRRG